MLNSNYQTSLIITLISFAILAVILLQVNQKKKKRVLEEINAQKQDLEHQKRMLKAAMESHENERKQIARDLQNDIGMMLMTMRVNLNNQASGTLSELRQLVDKTHESIRRMSWHLMPSTMEDFGLSQSAQEMCERLSTTSIRVSFHEAGNRTSLDKDQELLLYRITQEAITNAIRHSNASKIDVHFNWNKSNLTLLVLDDGLGFDFSSFKSKVSGRHGLGLYNMENRVALLGGELSFDKNNPSGTVVSVKLPLAS